MFIGRTISHYRIIEKLGEGGMGEVYKAEDTKLKRTVALKFLKSNVLTVEEEKTRFIHEAQAAASLSHQNICTIHEIDEVDKNTFIAMEYIDGESLKEKIKSKQLNLDQILNIATQISKGLQEAHEKGLIHRDIKSANIMITSKSQVKIMDFGLAKFSEEKQLTKTGTTLGTIGYMSPEQIQAAEVDHRSDLWSFGVLLYEMLTGSLPFTGDYEAAIIYKILNDEPKAIQLYRSDVPDNVLTIISQLLQKDPANRISSAKGIIEGLRKKTTKKIPKDDKKSIAVLYFENMSLDKENEYFCAGMTEDLIIDLSRIKNLKVISRSDLLPFRNKDVNSRQIGEMLGVNYIVEGSVRRVSKRIRITAQLIDVKSGFQVWADRYDRLVEDIFDIQTEVSQKIVEALKVSLTESEKQSLEQKPTDDLRAYDFYLRGSEFLLRRGKQNIDTAIQMFEHALSIDPNFTLAYVGLAEAYSFNYVAYDGDRAWVDKMMEISETALNLDPDLIEAQVCIGIVYFHQKRFKEAERNFEKVIQSKNDFYPAFYWLGITSVILNDYESAIKYFKCASAIKPYSEEPLNFLRETFLRKGDLKAANEEGNKTIRLVLRKLEVNPNDFIALSRLALTYANMGEKEKALDAVKRVININPNDGMAVYNCASSYAFLGMKKDAHILLKKALEVGFIHLADWMLNDPNFDPIRDDSDFQELLSNYGV